MPGAPPRARDFTDDQIAGALARYVERAGGGVLGIVCKEGGEWVVSAEFGKEAPDSPMAAGAAYGLGNTLRRALEVAAHDCGLLLKEDDDPTEGQEELAPDVDQRFMLLRRATNEAEWDLLNGNQGRGVRRAHGIHNAVDRLTEALEGAT